MSSFSGKIQCPRSELNLACTLAGGQSFRWKKIDDKWTGVFADRIWTLHQNEDFLFYEVFQNFSFMKDGDNTVARLRKHRDIETKVHFLDNSSNCGDINSENLSLLKCYLRLEDLNLKEAYFQWSSKDKHFERLSISFPGIRILNQDPVENLFSFICSSNNNINRISSMVEKMCTLYGEKIHSINGKVYNAFPSLSSLAEPTVESQLKSAGFGYRARYISQTAVKLTEFGGKKWLGELKNLPYDEAREKLMLLPGVGAKVADCVCLMSLSFMEAVPVDTHIFKVAVEWYLPHLRNYKSVTPRIHKEIGDFFRDLYGPFAGWAHTILFCSSLKMFHPQSKCHDVKLNKRKKIK